MIIGIITKSKQVCNAAVTDIAELCGREIINVKSIVMNKEKAKKIQKWYNYFRFAVIVMVVGVLICMAAL